MAKKLMQLSAKNFLLFDGLGALLSAFLLGVVLVELETFIGMPVRICYILAAFPFVFALFDGWAYFLAPPPYASYLRIVAYLNIGYCVFSASLLWFHYRGLTTLAWVYFIIEIVIVLTLAGTELYVAKQEN